MGPGDGIPSGSDSSESKCMVSTRCKIFRQGCKDLVYFNKGSNKQICFKKRSGLVLTAVQTTIGCYRISGP